MRDLIRQILREYTESKPILVYEIIVSKNLNESEFIRRLSTDDIKIDLLNNEHSKESIGNLSPLQRVDIEEIDFSIMNIKKHIVNYSKKILETCTKRCGINVIDYGIGIEYHLWLNKRKNGNIRIEINTSIRHPKHLFYRESSSPTIIVDKDENVTTRHI